MVPVIIIGCVVGILTFKVVPQRLLDGLVIVLAAVSAVQLLVQLCPDEFSPAPTNSHPVRNRRLKPSPPVMLAVRTLRR